MDNVVVPVTFCFPEDLAPDARTVTVVGSFNGWSPTAHRLQRSPYHDWATTVYLPPGRIVYLFSVDGALWLDPADDGRIPNGWGSEYSTRHVPAVIMADAHERAGQPFHPKLFGVGS